MTTKQWNQVLLVVVVIETAFILFVKGVRVQRKLSLADYEVQNPIGVALEYESPLQKFEEVVRRNRGWVTYRQQQHYPDAGEVKPVLAKCASLGYTNHVQVLLRYGAEPGESIRWLRKNGSDDAVRLIEEQVQEVKTVQ